MLSWNERQFITLHLVGVIFWRGFSLYDMMSQCYGNADDIEKGRSMPVHYGSRELNLMTISSPLGTQIPQGKNIFRLHL